MFEHELEYNYVFLSFYKYIPFISWLYSNSFPILYLRNAYDWTWIEVQLRMEWYVLIKWKTCFRNFQYILDLIWKYFRTSNMYQSQLFYLNASWISFLGPWCQVPMPKVGIIAPVFNLTNFLSASIASTIKISSNRQTKPDWKCSAVLFLSRSQIFSQLILIT